MTAVCVALAVATCVVVVARGPSEAREAEARPSADRDGDEVLDAADRCPEQAGLLPDGCPPRDRDADGVLDSMDGCAEVPGPIELRGCPDTDRDADGVVDRRDACPDELGDARFGGCIAPDRDTDGVPDALDRCVSQAEVWNGERDGDGCPDSGSEVVRVLPGRVAVVRGGLVRSGGRLSSRGRRAVAVMAALLDAAGAQRVRVAVPAATEARAKDRAGHDTAAEARALGDALRALRPRLDIRVANAPLVTAEDAARLGRRYRARVELAFE